MHAFIEVPTSGLDNHYGTEVAGAKTQPAAQACCNGRDRRREPAPIRRALTGDEMDEAGW